MKKLPKVLRDQLVSWGKKIVPELEESEMKTVFPDAAVEMIYEFAYHEAMKNIIKDNKVRLMDFKIALKQMKTATENVSTAVKELSK